MTPIHRIAVIQLHPKPLDVERNFNTAAAFIRDAAAQGAALAVLPEYHLTSWVPDDPKFVSTCVAASSYLSRYQALAAELNICIVPGTIIERVSSHHNDSSTDESKEGEIEGEEEAERHLVNTAYFISPQGTILGAYTKRNLWHPERPHLTPAPAHIPHTVIDTPLGPVGLLICWDLAFPEAFRALITAGAKIIVIPTFWTLADCSPQGLARNPRAEALFLESTLVSRAFESTCAVIFCNTAGPRRDTPPAAEKPSSSSNWCGLSQITLPFVGAVGKLGATEDMAVWDVDMDILEEAEDNYRVREDLGRDGWHYGYKL